MIIASHKKNIIVFILILITFLLGCSKKEIDPYPKMYLSINGDLRRVNDIRVPMVQLFKKEWKNGVNFSFIEFEFNIYDPDKKYIGDIGGFQNDHIQMSTYIYSTNSSPFDEEIQTLPCSMEQELYSNTSNVSLMIKDNNYEIKYNESSSSGTVNVKIKEEQYHVELKNVIIDNNTVSVRLIYNME